MIVPDKRFLRMVRFGVIADDFTGACDAGIQFKKHGLETLVLADAELVERIRDSEVAVIDTESRNDSPDTARTKARRAAKALKKTGVRLVYKKIDSTLRGNIGAELNSIMDELDLKTALISPAFPAAGRTVVSGRQLVNGTPLEKTEFSRDPLNPVTESHIPTLIQRQTQRKVGVINLSKVREGVESLTKEIQRLVRGGFEILVADAETQNDLKMIARASLDSDILPCGSAGLAEGVSYWLASKPRGQRVLVVSGSVNTVTLDQISAVRKKLGAKVLEPDLSEVLMGGENREAEARRLLRDAQKAVAEGRDAILRLVESKDRLDEIRKFGRELRMDYAETVEKILSFLGDVSTEAIERCGISGLILVGGDTAINVVKGMGAYGIRIEEEVSPGIPLGRIFGGRFDGLLTITKAGGFGRERTLIDAIEKLKESLRRA